LQRITHPVSFVENNSTCQKMTSLKMIGLCAVHARFGPMRHVVKSRA